MSIKIDLTRLLKMLLRRIWLPIMCAVIGAGGMFYYSNNMIPDTYTASATMYVYNANPNVVNYQYVNASDLNTAVQLLDTYMAVIKSKKVMEAVLEQLDDERLTVEMIGGSLSMGSVGGTGLLRVSSTTRDPELSMKICNAVVRIAPSEIIRVVNAGSMEVVDYAEMPQFANSHNTFRNMILGGMAGAVLALGILTIMFVFNQRVTESKELTDQYTLPLLSVIPHQPAGGKEKFLLINGSSSTQLLAAYEKLRMNVTFAMKNKGKVVLVSSAVPGEGKSTVAANLAIKYTQDGKRVLLIDGDMRKPTQDAYFGLGRDNPGLSDMLIGERTLQDVIVTHVVPNLDLIPAGTVPPNPSELLNSAEMRSFLQFDMQETYDVIILDVPPINVVSDPLVLSDIAVGLLFIVRSGYSDHREIRKALEAAEFTGVPMLGVVMTGATRKSEKSYKCRHYNKYYEGYSRKAGRSQRKE